MKLKSFLLLFFKIIVVDHRTHDGVANTAVIVATSNISADSAAHYCDDMSFGGYSDWALPSKSELAYVFCHANKGSHNTSYPPEDANCVTYGLGTELSGFAADSYWSSSERSSTKGWRVDFSDGNQINESKSNANYVRCVRRY